MYDFITPTAQSMMTKINKHELHGSDEEEEIYTSGRSNFDDSLGRPGGYKSCDTIPKNRMPE